MVYNYRGQIVRAEVISKKPHDRYYRLGTRLLSGSCKGQDCPVFYRGNPQDIQGEILVRLDTPFTGSGVEGLAAFFLTPHIPRGFESRKSGEAVFVAILEYSGSVPSLQDIFPYYHPGFMRAALHFCRDNRSIVPYRLDVGKPPYQMVDEKNDPMKPIVALRRYLQIMNKSRVPGWPQLVTMDANIHMGRNLRALKRKGLDVIHLEQFKPFE